MVQILFPIMPVWHKCYSLSWMDSYTNVWVMEKRAKMIIINAYENKQKNF
jgi:hypothetical protein